MAETETRPRRLPPKTETRPRRWQFFSRRDRDETLVCLETVWRPRRDRDHNPGTYIVKRKNCTILFLQQLCQIFQSPFEGCLYTALWNTAYVHVLWPTSVLSRKLKHHHYCLEHLNETSCKVWKCMDQQHSALVKDIITCFGCLPLSLTYVIGLNRHWSNIWSMTVPTVIQMSPQLLNISHRILLDPLL